MATSTIDGTIEEATLKRSFWNMRVFDPIVIRHADGTVENLGKTVVQGELADHIVPGASGRFYRYSTIDHQGIHGIRDVHGAAFSAFPMNNEIASYACIALGVVLLMLHLLGGTSLSAWGPILLLVGVAGTAIYGQARRASRAQFDGDDAAGT